MTHSIFEAKEILNNIDVHISNSNLRVDFLIKELGISTVTYYKKLKNKNFNVNELVKIFSHINPKEYDQWYLKNLLQKGFEDIEKGNLHTHDEVMADFDKRYLNQ